MSKLGAGGMAEVFKAHITSSPEVVYAIKRILPQYSTHKELISMLIREAGLVVSLSHPNIVPIKDFGVVDDSYFIAMEYIHGKDLKSIMVRLKSRKMEFPIAMATHVMTEVLRALDYAHHKHDNYGRVLQIVHRDISPQNVMISFRGQVKILDFGIAKALSKSDDSKAGMLKGKFSYMSPEQAMGDDVDPRTDVFAAGVVLWELLTLQNCFEGETDLELLENVRDANVRDLRALNSRIPPELSAIVMKALAKKTRNRYATAGEFADVLGYFQKERFGPVMDADISAFVRTLYALSPQDVVQGLPSEDSKPGTSSPRIPVTTQATGSFRAPWLKRPSRWLIRVPLLAVALAGTVWVWNRYPPSLAFRFVDKQAVRLATKVYNWRVSRASPSVTSSSPPPSAQMESTYTIQMSAAAQHAMDDLPFETFERVRDLISDLINDPHPRNAKPNPKRPGQWSALVSGYRITYQINDMTKAITIERVEKT